MMGEIFSNADNVSHTTTGTYNASFMDNVEMNVSFKGYTYEEFQKMAGNDPNSQQVLLQCAPNLEAAKADFKKKCGGTISSNPIKKVLSLKR